VAGGYDNDAAPFNQALYRRPGAVKRSEKVHRHDLPVDGGFCMDKGAALSKSGIIDKDVNSFVNVNNSLNGLQTFLLPAHITGEGFSFNTRFLQGLDLAQCLLSVHVDEGHPGAFPAESTADGQADSTGASCYHRRLIF
jgi:hypothetical protein